MCYNVGIMAEEKQVPGTGHENAILNQQLAEFAMQLDEIARDVRKIKRYFILTFLLGLAVTILPLIGILIALPYIFNAMTSMYNVGL